MVAKETARLLSGDKPSQERARRALPILVRQAHAEHTIVYGDLARELEIHNPRTLNYPLGAIGHALKALAKQWGARIPQVQCIAVNKSTGLPGEGIASFIEAKDFAKLPRAKQRSVIREQLRDVFLFPRWHEVLKELGLSPAEPPAPRDLASQASRFKGAGESEAHRRLKEFVALHPTVVGLPPRTPAVQEHPLPSGDAVDVLFHANREWVLVEVKSILSPPADLARGVFQCVKYRAVGEAWQAVQGLHHGARAVLVIQGTLPPDVVQLKNTLGVEVVEGVVPR